MVQKIETDQWGSLKPSTVQDLISVKMNTDRVCYDVNSEELFTSDFLKSAKSATMRSLSGGPGGPDWIFIHLTQLFCLVAVFSRTFFVKIYKNIFDCCIMLRCKTK